MLRSLLIDFKGSSHVGNEYTFWYNVESSAKASTDIHVLNYGGISKASCWYDVPNGRLYVNGVEGYFSMAGRTMTFVSVPDRSSDVLDFLNGMSFYAMKSGNPIHFVSPSAQKIRAITATLSPARSGSGDPSPENIRPITGASSVTVTRADGNGENIATASVQFVDSDDNPLTVYGGTVDVTAGKLAVTSVTRTLNNISSSNGWNFIQSANAFFTNNVETVLGSSAQGSLLLSAYDFGGAFNSVSSIASVSSGKFALQTTNRNLFVRDDRYNGDVSAFLAAMGDTQICYPLETPLEYDLTPAQLMAIAGTNIISTGAESVTIETFVNFEV